MSEYLDVESDAVTAVADALRAAEADRVGVVPPTTTDPTLTLDDAYRIQRRNIRRRIAAGERVVGHKIGLTSLAMQQQLGVDQPDFGVITDAMVVRDGGDLAPAVLIAPRVEAEFAFLIGEDLPPSPTLDALRAAVEGVAVALEIIDSRVADWRIGLIDTVADNASSARIVHGAFARATPELLDALPATVIVLERDGKTVASGPGAAVLGDPLMSLHWLTTAIGAYGDAFAKGEVVLAGAVAAALPLAPGTSWRATADGFAPVTLNATAADR